MHEIHVQNHVIQDFGDIKAEATRHFSEIYTAEPVNNSENDLMELVPRIVKRKDNERLIQRVTMEEIKDVVDDMEDDKALGPDGFNVNFIKVCWGIVQKDLFKMVIKFERCDKIGGSTNSAFLALIPKEKDATSFGRFRPISLCNIGYKIITKIMARILKNILPYIIPNNRGFIKGRKI